MCQLEKKTKDFGRKGGGDRYYAKFIHRGTQSIKKSGPHKDCRRPKSGARYLCIRVLIFHNWRCSHIVKKKYALFRNSLRGRPKIRSLLRPSRTWWKKTNITQYAFVSVTNCSQKQLKVTACVVYWRLQRPFNYTDGSYGASRRKTKSVSYLIKSSRLIGCISSVPRPRHSAILSVSAIRKLRHTKSFHHDRDTNSPKPRCSVCDCHVWWL